ncbi:MAG TPA: DcaP family trimeric outer membrane transporter [Burkholderiaceae bacterium]|nr:DcaP family trimeric outer membrane transporter [Burkholderiaceae bacterium]
MNTTNKSLAAAVAAAVAAFAPLSAHGQASVNDRLDQLELKTKDAVTVGDIPGSFRLPGSETSIRLYGHAEAHVIHDIKASSPDDIFTDLTFQPLDNAGEREGKTKLTAQSSRFGIETSTPTSQGTFNTKIETDFYSYTAGNRNRLRLRHAYGEYAGFLVGQTWSTFMDLDNLPETVDFNGAIGSPFSRRTMIRYTYNDPKVAKFTVALEDPEDQFGAGSSNERTPQLVARVDKSFDWGSVNVRLLSHEKRSATETERGMGYGVGGNYKITDKDLVMAQYAYVEGDFDHQYGSNAYVIDPVTGAITLDKNHGLIVGYAKTFTERLRGTLVYGMNRSKGDAAVFTAASAAGGGFPPANKRLQQLFVNVIYSPIKNIELGAEYIHGIRKTFSGDKGTMSRIDVMGRYSF